MTGLTLTVMKLGLLAALWVFVLISLAVIRTDLFGAAGSRLRAVRPAGRPVSGGVPLGQTAARPRRGGAPTRLHVTAGSLAGTSVPLGTQQITLGRAHDSTIVLDDDFASSRHARVFPDPSGQWVVEDLGSTNGTYLDRTKINGPTPVPAGVPIRIGKTVLELRK
ncbi:MAG TPA: FHA domain-containing protein [Actinocrinis sp.]|uniref:FHA domain-containing protein FhaB/FipA n=1 Tax=Actinocrinis sp. TaxID=1920516 RepID=UPI002DDDA66E|nr:FHA domain-containing protein [Actinocrinis sp.]HEV2344336.1 FHA domain-containing protein [Actinocrinis sp.]